MSPSTRRAWIEITRQKAKPCKYAVALHPEGVDRNINRWLAREQDKVALHPEGVDRNRKIIMFSHLPRGRPPPGGRG